VLEQIGDGVATDLEVGDHVMAIVVPNGSHGAYAEHLVVPIESVARVPKGASDPEAATLPMNALTARMALDILDLKPGQTLLVTGAAGALGGYAIQLAKAEGLRVVADTSEKDESLVKALGADVVVRRGESFASRVRQEVGPGADAVIDGAVLNEQVVGALRDGGRMVTVRGYEGDQPGITYLPIFVRNYAREQAKLDRLRQQVEDGTLTLRVARTFPAEQAAEAHRLLEAGGTRGRIILEF
jgi:NADPH:quinone reductase-like Zn-dependent oxidoreductase